MSNLGYEMRQCLKRRKALHLWPAGSLLAPRLVSDNFPLCDIMVNLGLVLDIFCPGEEPAISPGEQGIRVPFSVLDVSK